MNPKLSVLMPVYNGVQYLSVAIESVLSQSFLDFEFLILDDGSTEDVASVVSRYRDARIKFFSRENRGLGNTLNELISLARGEYLARMDADDFCTPIRFERQVECLDRERDIVMVGGQIRFLIGKEVCSAFPMPLEHDDIYRELSVGRFPICHPALTFRREACLAVGGYRVAGAGEDLDFFLRMSEQGRLANVGDIVLHYRLHSGSLSLKKQSELEKGYSYALYSARCRRNGQDEPSIELFESQVWKKRSLWERWCTRSHSISERFYRRSIVAKGTDQRLLSTFLLGVAGLLRPARTVVRACQVVRRTISPSG